MGTLTLTLTLTLSLTAIVTPIAILTPNSDPSHPSQLIGEPHLVRRWCGGRGKGAIVRRVGSPHEKALCGHGKVAYDSGLGWACYQVAMTVKWPRGTVGVRVDAQLCTVQL